MHGYSETILKYATDERYSGVLADPDGIGEVGLGAEEAGRKLAVRFTLKCSGDKIASIRYQVFGCGYTMAACAAAAELVEGNNLQRSLACSAGEIESQLGGLPEDRSYCAELAAQALQAALSSVEQRQPVKTSHQTASHGARVDGDHPHYQTFMAQASALVPPADQHLFACLLTVSGDESVPLHLALNLTPLQLETLLFYAFPGVDSKALLQKPNPELPPEINPDLAALLQSYLPADRSGWDLFASVLMARILAARAAQPGHLWVAMGFFERRELSAAIGRHLPDLLAANNQGMRWKRFLFKKICDLSGGIMCKSPHCGDCSDYDLCFAPKED